MRTGRICEGHPLIRYALFLFLGADGGSLAREILPLFWETEF